MYAFVCAAVATIGAAIGVGVANVFDVRAAIVVVSTGAFVVLVVVVAAVSPPAPSDVDVTAPTIANATSSIVVIIAYRDCVDDVADVLAPADVVVASQNPPL